MTQSMARFEAIMAADAGLGEHTKLQFAIMQGAKAALGAALTVMFIATMGRPDLMESIALAGLLLPGVLAICAFAGIRLSTLETISLTSFAALVGYLAALTGGMASPLMIWFALVPAEAALAGDRRDVVHAAVAAGISLLVVGAFQSLHRLPYAHFGVPLWQAYAGSALAAIAQSAIIAIAAQDRQRAADLAAAEGAAMYRFLADHATDLITRHGPEGRIRFASPVARNLLGVEPERLVGLAPSSLVHPDDLKVIQAAFVEASYFARAAAAEVRLKKADGGHVWTEMRCRPAKSANGKAADIVAVTRDISERKTQERALIDARDMAEDASRAKSNFLANMSHELRTPLNAIIGFSEVMSHEMFGPVGAPRYLEYARLIHESGAHLLDLINGVLDMSKIEAGKFALSEEVFDLEEATTQSLKFVKLQSDRKGVALKMSLAADTKTIFADRRAIKQILVNLLSNGVKFTPRGGEVSVTAARNGGGIDLVVADTGVGVSEKDLKRLGQPFEQVDGVLVRKQEGTGLGLALVKALTALHGGEIILESTLGVGTTVHVRLPHAATGSAVDGPPARTVEEATLESVA